MFGDQPPLFMTDDSGNPLAEPIEGRQDVPRDIVKSAPVQAGSYIGDDDESG